MGWLWSSSPSKSPQELGKDTTVQPPSRQSSAPNEPVDPEIQKFFDLFKHEPGQEPPKQKGPSPSSPSSTDTSDDSSSLSSWLSLKASTKSTSSNDNEAPIGDALSESLLPTEMSCRQAFDLAWGCNSLGGQFNSVYRYGNMRSCSEHWDDFWFCMRTRAYTGELKASMVRTHYRNKAYRKYGEGKPSSEDVWESRKEKLPVGSAFNEPIGAAQVDDDEWRRMEEERRRKLREGLGYQS